MEIAKGILDQLKEKNITEKAAIQTTDRFLATVSPHILLFRNENLIC